MHASRFQTHKMATKKQSTYTQQAALWICMYAWLVYRFASNAWYRWRAITYFQLIGPVELSRIPNFVELKRAQM